MPSNPLIGQIIMFGGNFAPQGWAFCDGSLQSIAQNTALFSLLGTTYGGDGQSTFGLPDLRGRIPMHQGQSAGTPNYTIGEVAGVESVTLATQQIPAHSHAVTGNSGAATSTNPANNFLAAQPQLLEYYDTANDTMKATATSFIGSNQPHENRMPTLTLTYIIAVEGIYPSRN